MVEEPFNIYSIEKTGLFHGYYHVLLGNLSPIRGIGPDELRISGLVERISKGTFREVILATSPTTEGSATAHYLTEILRQYKIRISRIARHCRSVPIWITPIRSRLPRRSRAGRK